MVHTGLANLMIRFVVCRVAAAGGGGSPGEVEGEDSDAEPVVGGDEIYYPSVTAASEHSLQGERVQADRGYVIRCRVRLSR